MAKEKNYEDEDTRDVFEKALDVESASRQHGRREKYEVPPEAALYGFGGAMLGLALGKRFASKGRREAEKAIFKRERESDMGGSPLSGREQRELFSRSSDVTSRQLLGGAGGTTLGFAYGHNTGTTDKKKQRRK